MKKCSGIFAAFLLGIAGVTVTPAICYGAVVHQMVTEEIRVFQPEDVKESEDGSEKLENNAEESENDGKKSENSGNAVYGDALREGTYLIDVESSSSMFRIIKAELTVKNGKMTAVLTLGGTGYGKLFMGTGEEAKKAEESQYIPFVEDENGAYTYEIPVEALNQDLNCAAFSKRKSAWYDRIIRLRAETLPGNAWLASADSDSALSGRQTAQETRQETVQETVQKTKGEMRERDRALNLEDGLYEVEVSLEGGSGRASVFSPAALNIEEGRAVVEIVWSSPYYDYMIVDGIQYMPEDTAISGRKLKKTEVSVFRIPVSRLDVPLAVAADTTAMGMPHEIQYELRFDEKNIKLAVEDKENISGLVYGVLAVVLVALAVLIFRKRKERCEQKKKM